MTRQQRNAQHAQEIAVYAALLTTNKSAHNAKLDSS